MKKTDEIKSLINYLDSIFVVDGEMITDNGEDSYVFSVNDKYGIIGVFDGCGGLGSRKYAEYNNKSGAYISSRIASKAVLEWFEEFSDNSLSILSGNTISTICEEIKERVLTELKEYEQGIRSNGIKGSMTKSFPTTASVVMFTNEKDILHSSYMWTGDSRGFILTVSGLTQITKDDIETGGDALDNISDDGKLTNVISAEGDFVLNSRIIDFRNSGILITATDGCFGYFSTPMEFEFMIIDTLENSNNVEEWKQNIHNYVKKYTADDYTMGLVVFGYKGFKKMKKAFEERHRFLKQEYIEKLETADEKEINHFWDEYKANYYGGV